MTLIRTYKNNQWIDVEMQADMPTLSPEIIQQRFYQLLEDYSIEQYPAEHRHHLGASAIGEDCWRRLWYQFRWIKLDQADPRMRRLWNRGTREEKVFEAFLMWAGVRIHSIDPKTDKQYVFSKVNGHYGGSTDGIGLISWMDDFPVILEYKTFKDDLFNKLKKDGLKASNPKYFNQMSNYGREWGLKWGLFGAVNKDNDQPHFEFVELDWKLAEEMEKKATDIIYSKTPPPRLSEQPAFWKCKGCTFNGPCHYNEPIEKNCRSCVFSQPGLDANWVCEKYGVIPKDFLLKGCEQWQSVV